MRSRRDNTPNRYAVLAALAVASAAVTIAVQVIALKHRQVEARAAFEAGRRYAAATEPRSNRIRPVN